MSDDLYRREILRLARDDAHRGRLEAPDATATVDNPLCGDRVTIDLALDDGRIESIRHHTRGCVLCNAAAAVVAAHAGGSAAAELRSVAASLETLLAGDRHAFDEPWRELSIFTPVAGHRSRHACVLLPFQAVIEALAGDGG